MNVQYMISSRKSRLCFVIRLIIEYCFEINGFFSTNWETCTCWHMRNFSLIWYQTSWYGSNFRIIPMALVVLELIELIQKQLFQLADLRSDRSGSPFLNCLCKSPKRFLIGIKWSVNSFTNLLNYKPQSYTYWPSFGRKPKLQQVVHSLCFHR